MKRFCLLDEVTPAVKFRVHFNRVNMQRGNPNIWTVHTSKACHQGRSVRILVPVETVYNPEGRQPRAYFSGRGRIKDDNGTIVLY